MTNDKLLNEVAAAVPTFEIRGGIITHKYLMGKSKWDLSSMYMGLLRDHQAAIDVMQKQIDELVELDESFLFLDPFDLENPPEYRDLLDYCRVMRNELANHQKKGE